MRNDPETQCAGSSPASALVLRLPRAVPTSVACDHAAAAESQGNALGVRQHAAGNPRVRYQRYGQPGKNRVIKHAIDGRQVSAGLVRVHIGSRRHVADGAYAVAGDHAKLGPEADPIADPIAGPSI